MKSTVKADIRKNRLVFTFYGWIRKKDLDSLYTDTRFCVADLKPGFQVITDLSNCSFGSLNCLSTYRKIMAFLMEKQAGQIVRITRKSSLIHKQIINISARLQGYKPTYVTSMEDAERVLAAGVHPQCLRHGLQPVPITLSCQEGQVTGMLVEISEEDCLVECESAPPATTQEELAISFSLSETDDPAEEYHLTGNLAGTDQDRLTIRFTRISEEDRTRLRKSLIRQAQQEPLQVPLQQ